MTRWRYETFFTKEPETIEWMNSFKKGDTVFDIGANAGLYSLYAAKRGCRVLAFEPESLNFSLLNKNIHVNHLDDLILGLNIAFSDKDGIDYLYIPKFQSGQALNNFGEARDWQDKHFEPDFKQSVISFMLDSFLEKYPQFFPNHIKVDVDGLEAKIISNGQRTLKSKILKSLLIEINEESEEDAEAVKVIESCGLKLKHRKHSGMFETGEFSKIYNYVFIR